MAHAVQLEVFEGPIDLLLHLITRQRVDIYDVPLAAIARDYLAAIGQMEDLDLEAATGFLVVAATLLELKSTRLLPGPAVDSEDARLLEERDALLARLVECTTYREAGTWLAGRLEAGGKQWPRVVGLEPQFLRLAPDPLARTSLTDIARAGGRVLAPRPSAEIDTTHVAEVVASVRAAIVELAAQLRAGGASTFRELCESAGSRVEVVARFLALLELYKGGAVDLEQSERFGDIRACWIGEVDVDAVLQEAEDYSAAESRRK